MKKMHFKLIPMLTAHFSLAELLYDKTTKGDAFGYRVICKPYVGLLYLPLFFLFMPAVFGQNIVTVGSANLVDPVILEYQLTPNLGGQSGSIWYQTKIDLRKNFTINGEVYLGNRDGGADGIAFVLQPLSSNLGGTGGGIGYAGISPSIAIEIDTWQNCDPAQDHAAIVLNGDVCHNVGTTLVGPKTFSSNVEDSLWHKVEFKWIADTKILQFFWDGEDTAFFELTRDIVATVFSGSHYVYLGFTAGTGLATNDQRVRITNVNFTNENISAIITNTTCPSLSNGAIDLSVTGLTEPLTFLWSNGAVTEDISGLEPGNYSVIITDSRLPAVSLHGSFDVGFDPPATTWYKDTDNDNYSNGNIIIACIPPVGYKTEAELTATTGDCNDNDAAINPGATEICDGKDNNCNGLIDEAFTNIDYQFVQQGDKLVGIGSVGTLVFQGNSVSLDADGNTAIVGGPADNSGQGAAWVYTRTGDIWTQQGAKLVVTGNVGVANPGASVSLSADGNTAILGGWLDNSEQGAAWVFTRSSGIWTQQGAKLVGTDVIGIARQGTSVSLSADGNTAIVGGYRDNSEQGAAWVFTRNGNTWTQQGPKLIGTGNTGTAYQGYSVTLSADGNTAMVGGFNDNSGQGATWVYTRSGNTWTQQGSKLVGTGGSSNDQQGSSVSLSADGNTAIIGGPGDNSGQGAVWVFTRSGSTWSQQGNKLVGTGNIGASTKGLSVSLSADGNIAIVGGYKDNSGQGASWVFTRNLGTWTQQGSKLVGIGGEGTVHQGVSVSMSADGNTAMVGGWGDNSNQGAAWVFSKSANACILVWFKDTDNDGYSDGASQQAHTRPTGYKLGAELTSTSGDCNDNNAAIKPGATEICSNGIDENCNGQTDEGCITTRWYRDADKDGYGNPNPAFIKIQVTKPKNYVANNLDCRDWDPLSYPGAGETGDGIDNNCNGLVDEGLACLKTWYYDGDGDGYGSDAYTRLSCVQHNGYVEFGGDCKNWDASVYPGHGCPPIVGAKSSKTSQPKAMVESPKDLIVFPNPASNEVIVTLNGFEAGQKLEIQMVMADGKVVMGQSLTPLTHSQQVRMDVRKLNEGYYLLQVRQGVMQQTKKVMIVR